MDEEEIFKHLEKMCILDPLCYEVDCLDEKDLQVLRALIELYNKQKEEIEELKSMVAVANKLEKEIKKKFISKDKIREKIKELEDKHFHQIYSFEEIGRFRIYDDVCYRRIVDTLKELLEED